MNKQEWYSKVIGFCQLSSVCSVCPYHLLTDKEAYPDPNTRPCFASKQALQELDAWLIEPHGDKEEEQENDNQWLKDLLKVQFDEDRDYFDEDQFI